MVGVAEVVAVEVVGVACFLVVYQNYLPKVLHAHQVPLSPLLEVHDVCLMNNLIINKY